MNDTKYTPVLVSYSLRNSKQPGFCQNSQVPRPLRITRLSEPFVGFPNNVLRRARQRRSLCARPPAPEVPHATAAVTATESQLDKTSNTAKNNIQKICEIDK